MGWKTRGLRGTGLEELLNITNDAYRQKNLAVVQKIPTPITPVRLSEDGKNITLAYFGEKSTVDYIGAVQGIPVCFDAKETTLENLPLRNIHKHQLDFMKGFISQKAVAFFIVYFKKFDKYYLLPFEVAEKYYENAEKGGRKSIPYQEFEKKYEIKNKHGFVLHYLEPLNTYLCDKE